MITTNLYAHFSLWCKLSDSFHMLSFPSIFKFRSPSTSVVWRLFVLYAIIHLNCWFNWMLCHIFFLSPGYLNPYHSSVPFYEMAFPCNIFRIHASQFQPFSQTSLRNILCKSRTFNFGWTCKFLPLNRVAVYFFFVFLVFFSFFFSFFDFFLEHKLQQESQQILSY